MILSHISEISSRINKPACRIFIKKGSGRSLILKERQMTLYLLKLRALERRLPLHHSKKELVSESLAKAMAGFRGEQAIDYPLSFLPPDKFFILHDLRLFDGTHYFQIDTLVATTSAIFILEVKNIAGRLQFETKYHQLVRTINGEEEAFPDPITQVERHQYQLKKWMAIRGHMQLTIKAFVVISKPSTIVDSSVYIEEVIHSARLPNTIISWLKGREDEISQLQLESILHEMMKENTSFNPDILERFQVKRGELMSGVICPVCTKLPMTRQYGKWSCSLCAYESKDAHVAALIDYSLLFHPYITNKEAREFLEIPSIFVTSRLLQAMKLSTTGKKKGRKYSLPAINQAYFLPGNE